MNLMVQRGCSEPAPGFPQLSRQKSVHHSSEASTSAGSRLETNRRNCFSPQLSPSNDVEGPKSTESSERN